MDDFDEIGVLNMVDLGIALFDEVLNLPNGAMDDELNSQRGFGWENVDGDSIGTVIIVKDAVEETELLDSDDVIFLKTLHSEVEHGL